MNRSTDIETTFDNMVSQLKSTGKSFFMTIDCGDDTYNDFKYHAHVPIEDHSEDAQALVETLQLVQSRLVDEVSMMEVVND